jgi:hypothetical protein
MSPSNEAIAYYDGGDDLSCYVTAAVTGKRFVKISGAKRVASQALASDGLGGNIPVAHCGAGQRPLGVSTYDAPSVGDGLPVMRGHKVVPVEAGAAATAGDQIMSDATGRAITWTSAASEANARCGVLLNTPTAAGQTAIVALDL